MLSPSEVVWDRADRAGIAVMRHPGDLAETAFRECRVRDHRADRRILRRSGEFVFDHFIALIDCFFRIGKRLLIFI